MNDLSAATKAGITLQVKGQPVEFLPLTIGSLGKFLSFVQFRDYRVLHDAGAGPQILNEVLRDCGKKRVTIDGPEVIASLTELWGLTEFLYLSTGGKLPRDYFDDLTPDYLTQLLQVVFKVSGFEVETPSPDSSSKKSPVKKR